MTSWERAYLIAEVDVPRGSDPAAWADSVFTFLADLRARTLWRPLSSDQDATESTVSLMEVMLANSLKAPDIPALLETLEQQGRHVGEPKYDGQRAVVRIEKGRVRTFTSRADSPYPGDGDLRRRFPEIVQALPDALPPDLDLTLDGEVGYLDTSGLKMDVNVLQHRDRLDSFGIRFQAKHFPMTFVPFDILHHGAEETWKRPYLERRRLLEDLVISTDRVRLPPVSRGLVALYQRVSDLGGEGIMLKTLIHTYAPGKKSDDWWKAKSTSYLESVDVVGLLEGKDGLAGNVGALVLARLGPNRELEFVGRAGSGLNDAWRRDLLKAAPRFERKDCPLSPPPYTDRRVLYWLNLAIKADIHFEEPVKTQENKEKGRRMPRFPVVQSLTIPPEAPLPA